ncbi:hypothetical protein EV286_105414 [Rhizobium sp. BK251]|nr:hypothetical protein EV286_105414 [Rhizobium sp. BK251]
MLKFDRKSERKSVILQGGPAQIKDSLAIPLNN